MGSYFIYFIQWEVAALSLDILRKLLHGYEIQGEHFMDQVVEMGSSQPVVANKPAGFTLMVNMLKDSRLYQMVRSYISLKMYKPLLYTFNKYC